MNTLGLIVSGVIGGLHLLSVLVFLYDLFFGKPDPRFAGAKLIYRS